MTQVTTVITLTLEIQCRPNCFNACIHSVGLSQKIIALLAQTSLMVVEGPTIGKGVDYVACTCIRYFLWGLCHVCP